MTPTLIVIDVQQEFDDPAWGERNNPGAESKVAEALSAWRERSAPIIHAARPSCAAIDANSRRERPGSRGAPDRHRTSPSRRLIHHGDVSA